MTLKLVSIAALVLLALAAIWILVIAPAEKRDHERRMALIRKKLEQRTSAADSDTIVTDQNESTS